MRRLNNPNIWFAIFLLSLFTIGCGDADRNSGTTPQLTPPIVLTVAPPAGSVGACINTVVTISFSKAMNPASLNAATFLLQGPGSVGVAGVVSYNSGSNTAVFTPSVALAMSTLYTATITTGATDAYGNHLASNSTWSFTTGVTTCAGVGAPSVISVAPAKASVGVCQNTIVTATFSEAMNPGSIDSGSFTLTGPGSAVVAGTVTYDAASNTAIFTPTSSLALSTLYTATITMAAQDLFGNSLPAFFVCSFTTGAALCQNAAPPISTNPPTGSVGVCSSTVISATFPQAMDPTTINNATFTPTPAAAGTISHDVANKTFTFVPSANLALATTYTVTISKAAKDTFGNPLSSDFSWTFTTAATACAVSAAPAVISVSPLNGAVGVCPNTVVTATFNKAMNPATINALTFTVTPGVTGVVSLDGSGRIALFTPSSNLALNTIYTATITTGSQDLSGNPLPSNFVWSFTTAVLACQAPVPLGSAANFEVLAGSTATNTGPTIITGADLGLSPGSAVTGFPPGTLTPPAVMHVTDPTAAQGQIDLTAAYNYAAGLPNAAVLPGELSGLTFTPGLYKNSSTVSLSAGNVTLDGQGDVNAVFIFQISSTLTTLGSTHVILAGGAQAKNVFWQVGSAATLGTNSFFEGNILALQSITLDTGANLTGRALARNGAVTMDSNIITAP